MDREKGVAIPVKSLLITFDFPPIVSGIGTFFYNVWRLLPGKSSFILAPAVKGAESVDREGALAVVRYPNLFNSRILRTAILLPYVLSLAVRKRMDVLVCGVPVSMGLIGLALKKMTGVPYVVFYYGGEYAKYRKNRVVMALIRSVLKNAGRVITNSEFTRNEVKALGIDGNKIDKITPGVDTHRFRPGIDCADIKKKFGLAGKKVILTVSRLVGRKGVDAVIHAMPAILKDVPDAIYLVVGDGPERARLEEMSIENGVRDRVVFAGQVPDDELAAYYNAGDIFVMANRQTSGKETFEGFGISFIEASACGKAVIGGASGGAGEAVADHKTGLLVDPADEEALIRAVVELLKDASRASEFGKSGRKRAEDEFAWKDRAARVEEIVRNCVLR